MGSGGGGQLTQRIIELARLHGRYGHRRITVLLHWDGWCVNHERVEHNGLGNGIERRVESVGTIASNHCDHPVQLLATA